MNYKILALHQKQPFIFYNGHYSWSFVPHWPYFGQWGTYSLFPHWPPSKIFRNKVNVILEPGLLGPTTIDDSNFYTIVAKSIQTENWNEKSNDTKLFLLWHCVCNLKWIRWISEIQLNIVWLCSQTNCVNTFGNNPIKIAAIYCLRS